MRTQAPDFWNDAKQAEKVMKQVRELKGWIEGCEAASGDPDCILGLSTDLVIKLHSVFDFLSEIRLDPWF